MTNFIYYDETISVCKACIFLDECEVGQFFPAKGCESFDDGQKDSYPDGDARREWKHAVIYQYPRTIVARYVSTLEHDSLSATAHQDHARS